MLLRKLEAYGFKSFAEKTEIEFKPGITAIVGPNGSGKSNISDAIRWVLGEQNIRNLRGAKMEDVIFSGSSKRRPLGVAEVSLVFDNSDGVLPLEFNEVTITRRVFRSGDGEYYINKSACRLKDIHDLLLEAGLGRESMTVISQNKIDEVLNSKPEERRLLFEEAAGIMKYKNRKKEALRKLEDTEQNLTRILDITNEIETQLDPLAESAERTARYNELFAEQTACQITLLLDKLIHAEKNLQSVTLEQAALNDDELSVSSKLALGETERERYIERLAAIDEAIRSLENEVANTNTELERIDGKAAVLTERIGQEQRNRDRLTAEVERIGAESEESGANLVARRENLTDKRRQVAEFETVLGQQQMGLAEIAEVIEDAQKQIEEAKDLTFGHLQELVTQKNMLKTLERDGETQKLQQANLSRELEEYKNKMAEAKLQLSETKTEQATLGENIKQTDAKIEMLTQQKNEIEQSLNEVVVNESHVSNHISELSSKLKILANMQEEYEGFGRGAKSVLKSDAPWRKQVGGAVAQILSVPDEYIVAIETALGGALQHIIVENDATAKSAIEYLKTRNLGRATFLPLNTIKPSKPREAENAAAHSGGALGFAADLVNTDPRYRPVVEFLLGRTVVAKDIDAALKIARQQAFNVRIVTLDGEMISPGGTIAGGSTGRRESSFISRGNEIDHLKKSVIEEENKRKHLRQRIADFQADADYIKERAAGALSQRRSYELRQAEVNIHLDNAQADIKRLNLAVATLETELANSLKDGTQISAKLEEINVLIASLEDQESEHKIMLAVKQDELKELQLKREKQQADHTDTKIKLSALQQEVNAIAASCEEYEQNARRLNRQIETLKAENVRVESEIERANNELSEIAAVKENLFSTKTEHESKRSTQMAEKLQVLAQQQKQEREVKDLRRKLNNIHSRLHELELQGAKYGYEVEYCNEQLRDNYDMSKEQAETLRRDEDPKFLTTRVQQLEAEISDLGTINPAAIDEYARVKERYEFLRTQYNDLTEAKNYLSTIIKDIDSTMSKQFRAAFQQINEHFGDLFVRLFGGGKAQLELADPDEILSSGIEILVQPPGKKQQNLALLSGGERALTVIALLFAFLTYRPTPFCVLDEIDAALDEANVQRFSEFLRDYSRQTQFIIVTHRKGTMEVADVMHGVTMEESGVSKLISVKFMEKAG